MRIIAWLFKLQFSRSNFVIFIITIFLSVFLILINAFTLSKDVFTENEFLLMATFITRLIGAFFAITLFGSNFYYKRNALYVIIYTRGIKRIRFNLYLIFVSTLSVIFLLFFLNSLILFSYIFLFKVIPKSALIKSFFFTNLFCLGYGFFSFFLITFIKNIYILALPNFLIFLSFNLKSTKSIYLFSFIIPIFSEENIYLITSWIYLIFYIILFFFLALLKRAFEDVFY